MHLLVEPFFLLFLCINEALYLLNFQRKYKNVATNHIINPYWEDKG